MTRAAAAGVAMTLLTVAAAAPAAERGRTVTASRTALSRLDFKAGSRLDDKPIGPERRVDDRRLSDERYLRYERTRFRRERKMRDAREGEERGREAAGPGPARVEPLSEREQSDKSFEVLFR